MILCLGLRAKDNDGDGSGRILPEPKPETDRLPWYIFADDDLAIPGPTVHHCLFWACLALSFAFVRSASRSLPTSQLTTCSTNSHLRASLIFVPLHYQATISTPSTMAAPNNVRTIFIDNQGNSLARKWIVARGEKHVAEGVSEHMKRYLTLLVYEALAVGIPTY